jgi:hypothetical protein
MSKSAHAHQVDAIQASLRSVLREHEFKSRGRTFNRATPDGLTQVVSIQMGASDPPGTTYIPGLRENLHGYFTINLGVYIPEVAAVHGGGQAKAWVQEYHCSVRARLGEIGPQRQELWWQATMDDVVMNDVVTRLGRDGLPFLDRFGSRDQILKEWRTQTENMGASSPPRIVMAVILARRGDVDEARRLLTLQTRETRNPGHPAYVRKLASELGLGQLDA